MTAHRDFKNLIRERQERTSEAYTAARAHVMRERAALLGLPPTEAPKATGPVLVDAIILKVNQRSARVRILGEDGSVTFRSRDVWNVVPGHMVTLVLEKRWAWREDAHASGRIENIRIDVEKMGLVPLPLEGGELRDLRSATEHYRPPDPYAPLWRKLTAKRRAWFEMHPIAWGALPGLEEEENPVCDAAELAEVETGKARESC